MSQKGAPPGQEQELQRDQEGYMEEDWVIFGQHFWKGWTPSIVVVVAAICSWFLVLVEMLKGIGQCSCRFERSSKTLTNIPGPSAYTVAFPASLLHFCLLALLLVPCAAAVQSTITTSAGNQPNDVSWAMVCSGGSELEGGAPFFGGSNATSGENCTLHMRDGAGDGWNGAHWAGLGQNLTLPLGWGQTAHFVVPSNWSADHHSASTPGCIDMDNYIILQPRIQEFPQIKTCAAAAENGLCSKVASVCPASCGACEYNRGSGVVPTLKDGEMALSRRQLHDRCENSCIYPTDGICDDGGGGSQYAVCGLGTDCDDCGARWGFPAAPPLPPSTPAPPLMPPAPPMLPPMPPPPLCVDVCSYPADGFCDDGGPGSVFADCDFGSDCTDCGSRAQSPSSPPKPPLTPPLPPQPPMLPSPPSPPPWPPLLPPPLPPAPGVVQDESQLYDALADGMISIIWLAPGIYFLLTIMCDNSALCIDRDVTIQAIIPGSVVLDADAVSSQENRRVIKISGIANVSLIGLNITGGFAQDGYGGGGLYIRDNAVVHMQVCQIFSNTAGYGGAIFGTGDASFHATYTIFDNNAAVFGSAILWQSLQAAYLRDCTFLHHNYPVIQVSGTGPLIWHCSLGKWSPSGGTIPIQPGEDQDIHGCAYSCPIGSIGTSPYHSSAEDCSRCPEGQYCPSKGLAAGVSCSAGMHMPATGSIFNTSCIPCSPGQFNDQPGRGACNPCPGGTYSEDVGATRCTDCSAGGYCPEAEGGAFSRLVYKYCPRGTWNNQRGSSSNASCTSCPIGKASTREGANGASTCQLCRTGTVAPVDGMAECSFCSPGKYQDSEGATGCEVCEGGSYCQKGAAAPLPCRQGRYSNATNLTSPEECTPTSPGFYAPTGSVEQIECSAGTMASIASQGKCSTCAPGKYQDDKGAIECKLCPEGYSCSEGASTPLSCTTGKHQRHAGQSACDDCTSGHACPVASVNQTACPPGSYSADWTCELCPGGKYQPNSTATSCEPCPKGSSCARGATLPTPCAPGTMASENEQATCAKCPAGKHQGWGGMSECMACESGSYCTEGAAAPLPCQAGSFSSATNLKSSEECTPTGPGFYAPTGSVEPSECSAGTFNDKIGQSSCNLCFAGTIQDAEGATGCKSCEAGHYCPKGASAALPCSKGYFSKATNLTKQSECTPAQPGFFSLLGTSSEEPCSIGEFSASTRAPGCDRCIPGTFQDKHGQSACTACKPGFWCTAEQAVPCAEDTYQPLANQFEQTSCSPCSRNSTTDSRRNCSSISVCGCVEGFYEHNMTQKWITGQVDCRVCPSGSDCHSVGTALSNVPIKRGYFRLTKDSVDIRRCPDAASGCSNKPECEESNSGCLGSVDRDKMASEVQENLCRPGLAGPFCRLCNLTDAVYYAAATNEEPARCVTCRNTARDAVIMVAGGVVTAAALLPVVVIGYYRHFPEQLKSQIHQTWATFTPHYKLRIGVGFYQIVTQIQNVYEVEMPPAVAQMLRTFSMGISIGLNGVGSVLECLNFRGFHSTLTLYILAPHLLTGPPRFRNRACP